MFKHTRVLAVDDNEAKAYALRRTLQAAGFPAEAVHSGRAALQATLDQRFDAVLLDVNMPDMSGYEVCSAIRAQRDIRQPVVIFHTAKSADEASIDQGRSHGGDAFLAHPIDQQALVAVLMHYVSLRDSRSAHLLGSWKEIANFFGKGVRTVQRWEHSMELPVHRPNDGTAQSIFADPDELRTWALRKLPHGSNEH